MKPEIIITARGHAGTMATLQAEFTAHLLADAPDRTAFLKQHARTGEVILQVSDKPQIAQCIIESDVVIPLSIDLQRDATIKLRCGIIALIDRNVAQIVQCIGYGESIAQLAK